jgi:hypothetical protein
MGEPPGNLSSLGVEHAGAFTQALSRILSSPVAEFTYSEILDGLPTEESFLEFHLHKKGNPVFELNHTSLCAGIIGKIRGFRDSFDPLTRIFPPTASYYSWCLRLACSGIFTANILAASRSL